METELRNWLGEYTDIFLRGSHINRFSEKDKQLILSNLIKLFESNFVKLKSYFLEVSQSLPEERRISEREAENMSKNYIKEEIAPTLEDIIAGEDFIIHEIEELILFFKEGARLDKRTQTSLAFGGLNLFDGIIIRSNESGELQKGLGTVVDIAKESEDMANMVIVILRPILDLFSYNIDGFVENARFSLEIVDGFEKLGKRYYKPLTRAISLLYPYTTIDTMEEFKSIVHLLKELYNVLSQNKIDNIEILQLHYNEDEANPYYEFEEVYIDNPVSAVFFGLTRSIKDIRKLEQIIRKAIEIAKQGKDPTPYLKSFITRD